jgi:hypothetical protein
VAWLLLGLNALPQSRSGHTPATPVVVNDELYGVSLAQGIVTQSVKQLPAVLDSFVLDRPDTEKADATVFTNRKIIKEKIKNTVQIEVLPINLPVLL